MSKNADIQRDQLLNVLEQWRNGDIDEREVHVRAESLKDQFDELPEYDETDSRSIPLQVLLELDALNVGLITKDDIPAMESFLKIPPGKEDQGWNDWKEYWSRVDFEGRRKKLANNPYYST